MDISEVSPDIIEAQQSTDDQNGGGSNKYGPDLLAKLRFSDFLAFPGVYVPMRPQIYSAACSGKKKNKVWFEEIGMGESIEYSDPMACLKSDQGDSVLHLVAAWGHVELVKSIVSECPFLLLELDSRDQLPLHVAARFGRVDVVKVIVEIIKTVSATLSVEDKERLNLYLWKDSNGDTPLHLALRVLHKKTAACLVNANQHASFVPNEDGITPLYMAVEAGYISLVKEMLKPTNNDGPDLQLQGRKFLCAALKARNIKLLLICYRTYRSPEAERDEKGNTCLSYAASIGFYEGVEYLMFEKGLVYVSNDDGSFPIHTATEKGHTDIVILILDRFPASIHLLNKHTQNILHIASKSGKVSFVLLSYLWGLSSMNQLMEKQDVDGNTPLHLATINWHPRTLFYLLNNYKGNCMYIRNNEGLTPLDIAESNLQSNYVYMERMTLTVLYINTTSKRNYQDMVFRKKKKKRTTRSDTLVGDNKEQYVNTLLVVAALVATVTFAAGFTIPGGFNSSGPKLGSAVLANDVKLICFMVFDILAMLFSILTIVTLIWGQLGDPALVQESLNVALPSLFLSLLCMPVGFYCGVYIAFAHVKGVLIFLLVTSVIFVILILRFLGPHVILHVPGIAPFFGMSVKLSFLVVGKISVKGLQLIHHPTVRIMRDICQFIGYLLHSKIYGQL